MNQVPKIFIGSSREWKPAAIRLQSLLIDDFEVDVWDQNVFKLNNSYLQSLFSMLNESDFACFIAASDDILNKRGEKLEVIRDNVLFEIGLCLGRFGPDRVFILYPKDSKPFFPTDLAGIHFLSFKQQASDTTFSNSFANPAQIIKQIVENLGVRLDRRVLRHENILRNSDSRFLGHMIDAALLVTNKRVGYAHEILNNYIAQNIVIPSRYYYITDEGAAMWLSMSHHPAYTYNRNSEKLLEKNAKTITDKIINIIGKDGIDLISVGSGDGKKDRILLKYLTSYSSIAPTYYYPLDISDKLLVECIATIAKSGFDPKRFRIKGIIGDFHYLSTIMCIYENRPSPNLFCILGNTIGNSDETDLVDELRRSLFTGDFILIDVNINISEPDDKSSFYKSKLVKEYSFLPLSLLGESFEPNKINIEPNKLSSFKSAKSTITSYQNAVIGGKEYENIKLSIDHRYDFNSFIKEFCDELGLELLFTDELGSAGILLARKE